MTRCPCGKPCKAPDPKGDYSRLVPDFADEVAADPFCSTRCCKLCGWKKPCGCPV